MKTKLVSFCCLTGIASAVLAQSLPSVPPGYTTVLPVKGLTRTAAQAFISAPASLPMWNFSVTANASLGGGVYTGTIIGRNPSLRAKSVTDINLYIIPLKITITDSVYGAQVYDPTVADACYNLSPSGHPTDVALVENSPMFQTNLYDGAGGAGHAPKMDGIDVTQGVPAQYEDAYMRANFWSLVQNTNYHLNFIVTTLPTQTLSFNYTGVSQANYVGGTDYSGCGRIGVVDINDYDSAIQTLLKSMGAVTPGVFPMLLTNSVVNGNPGTNLFGDCCALGYHSAYNVGPNLQVYSPFSVSQPFGDISTISHEVAEALMDPTTVNGTPSWGNEGQVYQACQNNLEVGDPLSPGFPDSIGTEFMIAQNGFTYSLQELTFFDWFFGAAPAGFGASPMGAGGLYSNNSAFHGFAKLCPNGGTNNPSAN